MIHVGPETDIYRCVYCDQFVAWGEAFCKHCGTEFSSEDAERMKAAHKWTDLKPYMQPVRFRNTYKCLQCGSSVSFGDRYCRGCGHAFTRADTKMMGVQNDSTDENGIRAAAIFFMIVVLFVTVLTALL